MKPIDVNPNDLEVVRRILREHVPECEVRAFGSRVAWTAWDTSDLDLVLMTDELLDVARMADLREAFVESDLPFKVDVVDWATTRESFRRIIEKDYVVLQQAKRENRSMGREWREVAIGELVEIFDGPHATPAKADSGPVFLGISNLAQGRLDLSKTTHLSEENFKRWTRRVTPAPGDLVFSYETRLGEAALIPNDLRCCLGRRMGLLRAKPRKVDSRFLLYVYLGEQFQETLRSQTIHGSTVNQIPLVDMRTFLIRVPADIAEQRAIAHILGTLDDKIELNRRMSETLEAMARALFKSWFVDFDPVHAKMDGRWRPGQSLPGLPAHLYDLFPDELVPSELGEIPEGWEVTALDDAIEVNPKRSLRKGERAPYLDMARMPTRGHAPDAVTEREFDSGMRFVNGDTLVARITPCLENGKTAFVDFLENGRVGWGSTEYIVLRPKPPLPDQFAYCLARSPGFRDFAIQSMTGSSGRQRIPASALSHYALVLPAAREIPEAFGRLVAPLFCRASQASGEARTLAALRDTLLPKLISGELRIPDAERILARAEA